MNKKKVQLCLPNDREKLSRTIQSGGHGDCILCKLHGTIDTPESIVLTKSDYDKVYSEDAPLTKTLEICMKGKNLLFLGCSLKEDRTMDFLKSVYEKGIYHYAVFPSKEDKIGETSRYLGNKSILSILFPEGCFECVAVILETINDLVEYERSKEAVVRISKYYGIDVSDIMKMIDKKRKPVDMNDIADQAKGEKTIDINKLIEQAKDMQEKVSIAQEELENRFVQGTDEDKLIEVEMSCTKSIKKITIDETLLSPGQKQNLENQMVEAFMDAKDKADEIAVSAMEEATGGLVLPNI
jgi:DNA-binding protein YbaB